MMKCKKHNVELIKSKLGGFYCTDCAIEEVWNVNLKYPDVW